MAAWDVIGPLAGVVVGGVISEGSTVLRDGRQRRADKEDRFLAERRDLWVRLLAKYDHLWSIWLERDARPGETVTMEDISQSLQPLFIEASILLPPEVLATLRDFYFQRLDWDDTYDKLLDICRQDLGVPPLPPTAGQDRT